MSMHDDITQAIRETIGRNAGADIGISPSLVAGWLWDLYIGESDADPHIEYGFREHAKHIAMRELGQKFNPDSDESEAYQDDMFTDTLQRRYPKARGKGEEPVYIPIETMTAKDFAFNIKRLQRGADARVKHARALQQYADQQRDIAAA